MNLSQFTNSYKKPILLILLLSVVFIAVNVILNDRKNSIAEAENNEGNMWSMNLTDFNISDSNLDIPKQVYVVEVKKSEPFKDINSTSNIPETAPSKNVIIIKSNVSVSDVIAPISNFSTPNDKIKIGVSILVTGESTTPIVPDYKTKIKNECFLYQTNMNVLPNILHGKTKPNAPGKIDKNIFFHETSCTNDGVIKLTAREACAIESAARENPDWEVFVLFTAKLGFNNKTRLPLIDQLTSYPNIHFRHINIDSYMEGTPLEKWMAAGDLYASAYFNVHLADTLRLLSLWKYGGTYLDLDVVVLKSFNPLMTNYAGEESANYIANGVMNFDSFIGHSIVEECLRELSKTFNGKIWATNGPLLVTRVLQRVCNTTLSIEMTHERCGFQVLPISTFYAIYYPSFGLFFDPKAAENVFSKVKDSTLIHVWNKLSFESKLKKGSGAAYGLLADLHCNKVYNNCGEVF